MNEKERTAIVEGCRRFAEDTTGWQVRDIGIKAIVARNRRYDEPVRIEVDQEFPHLIADSPGEKVIAIFESNAYLVVTPNRGGIRGIPYLFGKHEVLQVIR